MRESAGNAQQEFLRRRAKAMRSEPTDAELKLWQILRGKRLAGFKFKRQVPVDRYIADFVCFSRRLIIEADGSQHVDSEYDTQRDAYLRSQGFEIMRFSNYDILTNDEGVAEMILAVLDKFEYGASPLSPTPLPHGERGSNGAEGTAS
ncbi:endonuclease domain-containing protein [Blastomonas sp. AAP53]|uniref:endonuclease domain-containing protein n=1 Tax=Blastomonas sp. AAP53 TaxID=1248760 RepID=UPI0009DA520D|nr:endonuclease domain-containing protein [Blastomonas sp. AAP53]